MVRRRGKPAPTYRLWLEAEAHDSRAQLPGKVRQRVKRLISSLADQPRPAQSQVLDITDLDVPTGVEIRRMRLEQWRIIYAVNDNEKWAWILAIRQRPPYEYEDLPELIDRLAAT
jgi:mRNA interferase RelE/StbE